MKILNMPALAVLAATLVVGCDVRETPANHMTDESSMTSTRSQHARKMK